jgi:hypothetical protein
MGGSIKSVPVLDRGQFRAGGAAAGLVLRGPEGDLARAALPGVVVIVVVVLGLVVAVKLAGEASEPGANVTLIIFGILKEKLV